MQILIGAIVGIALTIIFGYFFLKTNQFQVLLVSYDRYMRGTYTPFLQSKSLYTGNYVDVFHGPLGATGRVSSVKDIDIRVLADVLEAKNPDRLESIIKSHFPKHFEGYQLALSTSELALLLQKARDTRQIKHIDSAIEVTGNYLRECNRWFKHLENGEPKSAFNTLFYKAAFIQDVKKFINSNEAEMVYDSLHKPWGGTK